MSEENKISIDLLYDMLRNYIMHENRRPSFLLMHPFDHKGIEKELYNEFGYSTMEQDGTIKFQEIKIIRTFDIEKNKVLFA